MTDSFVHPAVFYRGTRDYLAQTVPFLLEGLSAGMPTAVAVPGPNLAAMRAGVAEHDADLAERVRWLDMTEVGRNPGRIIPGVLRAFADEHRDGPVRIIGEPIWPSRSEEEYPACAQHEALINAAFRGRAVTILCPYDADLLDPEVLADAEMTHPVLVAGERTWASDAYAPDRVVSAYNRPLAEPAGGPAIELVTRNVGEARREAVAFAAKAGIGDQRQADVALVVTELVTNSVEHGGGTARLRTWAAGDAAVFEVFDTGRIPDPMLGRLPVSPGQTRGRGLLLVNLLSDLVRMHVTEHGSTIRSHFTVPAG